MSPGTDFRFLREATAARSKSTGTLVERTEDLAEMQSWVADTIVKMRAVEALA